MRLSWDPAPEHSIIYADTIQDQSPHVACITRVLSH